MCGIAGLVSRSPISESELGAVGRANHNLAHRGPDGEGRYSDAHVALAMRRLSIIDLSGGWQPLYNEDRSLVIVANGEIYNYVELRHELANRGHQFSSDGDIETILHLYEEHGLDCVHYLRGMFAFALWDTKRRRLMLARDRMGEKPLYYFERDGQLIFASELKSLLASGRVPFELDADAVNLYFHYQYVPEPLTPLQGVRKLDAAYLMTIDVDEWAIEEKCYWRMDDAAPLEGDPATLIREQLETIGEIVIRSDVPVGVALSGGFDSSAIAALAARKYPGTMHAFSVGYPGRPQSDERADAQALADHLGLPFHDIELSTAEMVAHFPGLVYWRDDPIADISGFGYYAVMKVARENDVPVVLQGQGGDELFWGYDWVRQSAAESARKLRLSRHGTLGSLPGYLTFQLPRGLSRLETGEWIHSLGGLRPGLRSLQRDRHSTANQLVFYDLNSDFWAASQEPGFYAQRFLDQLNGSDVKRFFTITDSQTNVEVAVTRLICDTYLRENGVTQGDRLSMASSIELRLPLLDHRLVETVIGLRKAHSDLQQPAKAWFRAAIGDLLPKWVTERPKRGFSPPVIEWHHALFSAYGKDLVDGYLCEHYILRPESAAKLSSGPFPAGAITPLSFKALVLEQWCRRMLN